jgi:thiamine biosynthesis lipoprotein ApbE
MLADALSTAVSVMGIDSGLRLIEQTEDAAGMITISEEGKSKSVLSSRFAHRY